MAQSLWGKCVDWRRVVYRSNAAILLEFQMLRRAGEGDDVANIGNSGDHH